MGHGGPAVREILRGGVIPFFRPGTKDEKFWCHFLIRTKRTKNRSPPHFYPVEAAAEPQTPGNLVSMHEELGARAWGEISNLFFSADENRRKFSIVVLWFLSGRKADEKIEFTRKLKLSRPAARRNRPPTAHATQACKAASPPPLLRGFRRRRSARGCFAWPGSGSKKGAKLVKHGRVSQSEGKELHQNPLLKWRRICFCFTPRARAPLDGLQKALASGDEKDVLGSRSGHRAAAHSSS